jgi:hypothetical protein
VGAASVRVVRVVRVVAVKVRAEAVRAVVRARR